MKNTKYLRIFVGVFCLSSLYGFDYQAAVKVDQSKTTEVLAVAKRVIESANKLQNNPLDRNLLKNMVAAAFSGDPIEVEQLVDFDILAKEIKSGGENQQSTRLANSDVL
jgi:hypothetical protein